MMYWTLILSLLAITSGILGFTEFQTVFSFLGKCIFYLTITLIVTVIVTSIFEQEIE